MQLAVEMNFETIQLLKNNSYKFPGADGEREEKQSRKYQSDGGE